MIDCDTINEVVVLVGTRLNFHRFFNASGVECVCILLVLVYTEARVRNLGHSKKSNPEFLLHTGCRRISESSILAVPSFADSSCSLERYQKTPRTTV
jgi:hypothetical protein